MYTTSFILILFSLFQGKASTGEDTFCLSAEEKKLFDIINSYRETRDLEHIPFSVSMSKVAKAHVRDLVDNYTYKTGAKCNPHSWSDNGIWSSCCYTADHKKAQCMWDKPKEIANYDGYGYEILFYSSDGASAGEALTGWQNSSAHHAVMINTGIWDKIEWGALGIGIYGQYAVAWFGETEEEAPLNVPLVCQ